MPILGVNIDHIATLRQARKIDYPDPVRAALLAQKAGAEQITFHLREDRRHIIDSDLPRLKECLSIPLNMEMAASEEMLKIACQLEPEQVSIVPEKREELTTEGGLNILQEEHRLRKLIPELQRQGIKVSLFIDPEIEAIKLSKDLNADHVELQTGTYSEASTDEQIQKELQRLSEAAAFAKDKGLYLAAGHGLHYSNILPLLELRLFQEYNIGHFLMSEAFFIGLPASIQKMLDLLKAHPMDHYV